jgi:hypothetical protein
MSKPIRFTAHALHAMDHREIEPAWVERVLRQPEWIADDPADPILRRAFAQVPERANRYMRVVYSEGPAEWVIVTAFLDRDAKPPGRQRP